MRDLVRSEGWRMTGSAWTFMATLDVVYRVPEAASPQKKNITEGGVRGGRDHAGSGLIECL